MDNASKNYSNLVSAHTFDPIEVGGCFRVSTKARKRRYSPSGSRFRQNYVKTYDAEGAPTIKKAGVEDVHDSIQKAAKGITVEDLIRRAKSGDVSAIGPVIDSFIDITGVPSDFLEAHTKLNDAKVKFYSLPVDVRSKFNNSFQAFIKASADPGFLKSVLSDSSIPSSPEVPPLSAEEISKIRSSIGGSNNA